MNLYSHQVDVLKATEEINHVAYYLDMGLGKTFVGSEKAMSFDAPIILVVCQKSKIDDWMNHFFTYYIDKRKCDESGAWCYNLTTSTEIDMFTHSRYKVMIGIINYDLLWRREELIAYLNKYNFTLMLDESSIIQNTTAKWTKQGVMKLTPQNVILLSGTPTAGKYENLWTQIHLLGWDISEELYNKQYVNWKLIDVGGIKHKVVDKDDPYKNIERLKGKMRSYGAVFMKSEEVLDLPEQTFTEVKIKASKEYKKFMKDGIVNIDGIDIVGDTSLTKRLRARQLCGQYSKDKLDALKDLIESTNDRLIIFYNFNEELFQFKQLCEELNRPVSEVNGSIKDLSAYESESNSITLCQYQAAAMGLNLQKANKIIFYTLPERSELFEQSKKRIHRIGQKDSCFYYVMMCRNSIEERIYETLKERKDYTDNLFKQEMDV